MRSLHARLVTNSVLRDAVALERDERGGWLVGYFQVPMEDGPSHVDAFFFVWVGVESVPPVAAEHDCHFGAGGCVLALDGVRVEDDAECTFGVLCEWDRARDEVPKSAFWEDIGILEVKVDNHNRYGVG